MSGNGARAVESPVANLVRGAYCGSVKYLLSLEGLQQTLFLCSNASMSVVRNLQLIS